MPESTSNGLHFVHFSQAGQGLESFQLPARQLNCQIGDLRLYSRSQVRNSVKVILMITEKEAQMP